VFGYVYEKNFVTLLHKLPIYRTAAVAQGVRELDDELTLGSGSQLSEVHTLSTAGPHPPCMCDQLVNLTSNAKARHGREQRHNGHRCRQHLPEQLDSHQVRESRSS